ncbi:MAG: glycogen debranching protein [Caldilinea sp. CFX5]|nr:glycogen debranching protein [Caldilinea sp. CFX5]
MNNDVATHTVDLDRSICRNLSASGTREWLVTNGIGGYAAGTVAGVLSRRYHGLLVAALKPPLGRTLLATKLDETATYNGQVYPLFANVWQGAVVDPLGFHQLDHFYLDGTTPVWEYTCADAMLEKRIWMQQGQNTTYVRYRLQRASQPLHLTLKALVNYRDYHSSTHAGDWRMQIDPVSNGLRVNAYDGATPFYLLSDHAQAEARHEWYRNFALSVEAYRGLDSSEDHLYAGDFTVTLQPGEAVTLIFSTNATANLDGMSAYGAQQQYEQQLLAQAKPSCVKAIDQLVLAADQFIVSRPSALDPNGHSVIAGYPWFGDWGRDTMIALPGLTLTTGRPAIAASILRTFAGFVDQGMLPNRFPDAGETPEYNTADATLWYFEAIRAYHTATGDDALLRDLFPVLQGIIDWHVQGTRYQIHVDPSDGLLYAGEPGVQLTWMDAKVGDWVVTPRMGKAVELNALWYNALCSMADFAKRLRKAATPYAKLAKQAQSGFSRFWSSEHGYCYDVIDTPDGNDARLRPNQLFAVSLPFSPLTTAQQKAVVDVCAQRLLTPHGLHSLAPGDPAYVAHYGGNAYQRDSGYHQGTVWAWLIGPFVLAHLRVYQDKALARSYLLPLLRHLSDHGLGSISEIFDAEAPFTPRGCFAQAWSVAEVLRAWAACEEKETA